MKPSYKGFAAGVLASALLLAPLAHAESNGYCIIPAWKTKAEDIPQAVIIREKELRTEIPHIAGIVPAIHAAQNAEEAKPERRYLGRYYITGYDTCVACCGKTDGITASGTQATVGRTCAASKDIPFGTRLYIEGIGERIVEDRGGGVKGNHIDVLCEDHPACYAVTGYADVWILED